MCKGFSKRLVSTTLLSLFLCLTPASAQEVRYFYDELGRLIAVMDPAGTVAVYEYDAVGNLLRIVRSGQVPTLTSITPTEAPAGTVVTVTIAGTNLAPAVVTTANPGIVVSGTTSTLTTVTTTLLIANPTVFGATTLTVITPGGTASIPFTVTPPPPPVLTRLTPNAGFVGDVITVEGSGLGTKPGSNTVTFAGLNNTRIPAPVLTLPTPQRMVLTVQVPLGVVNGPVTVTVGGQTSNGLLFRTGQGIVLLGTAAVGTPADPILASANAGQPTTILGRGFTANTRVTFSTMSDTGLSGTREVALSTMSIDGSLLTVGVPLDAATGQVSIVGLGAAPLQIVPTLTGGSGTFTPGASVTLIGSGFIEAGSTITFGSVTVVDTDPTAGPDVADGNTNLTVTVPAGAGTTVTVSTAGGTSNPRIATTFTGITATATQGTPADPAQPSANVNQTITMSGTGILPSTSVIFSSRDDAGVSGTQAVRVSTVSSDGTSATVVVPSQAATGPVRLIDFFEASQSHPLQIVPTLTGVLGTFTPGASVTLSGSGFIEAGTTITFGSVSIVDTDPTSGPDVTTNNTNLTVTVPDGAGTMVTVTTAGGTSNTRIVDLTGLPSVVATIQGGFQTPRALAVTPDGTQVYVANDNAAFLSVIDTSTNTVVRTFPLPNPARALAFTPDGTRLLVTANNVIGAFGADDLNVFDVATGTLVRRLLLNGRGSRIGITPDGQKAYVAVTGTIGGELVKVFNLSSLSQVASLTFFQAVLDLDMSADGTRVYVAQFSFSNADNRIQVIDTSTDTVIASIPMPFGLTISGARRVPRAIGVFPSGGKFYVAVTVEEIPTVQALLVIDAATLAVVRSIRGFPVFFAGDFVISSDGVRVFIPSSGGVAVLDGRSEVLLGTIAGVSTSNLAITPNGRRVYASQPVDNSVAVIE